MRRIAAAPTLLVALALAGCSSTSDQSIAIFAEPGKYQYHDCDQLLAAAVKLGTRQQELTLLINAAGQSAVGSVVGTMAYRGEHRMNAEELTMIEGAARSKNCLTAANWRSNAVIR